MATQIDELDDSQKIGWLNAPYLIRTSATMVTLDSGTGAARDLTVGNITGTGSYSQFNNDMGASNLFLPRDNQLKWNTDNTSPFNATPTAGIARDAAATLRVSDGSTGIGFLSFKSVTEAHTSGDTLTAVESGSTHTNTGAAGSITLVLPAATNIGAELTFYVGAAQNLVIDAAGTDLIRNGASVSSAGGTATNGTVGSIITLRCVVSGTWAATATPIGTWTLA